MEATQRQEAESRIEHLAGYDALTGAEPHLPSQTRATMIMTGRIASALWHDADRPRPGSRMSMTRSAPGRRRADQVRGRPCCAKGRRGRQWRASVATSSVLSANSCIGRSRTVGSFASPRRCTAPDFVRTSTRKVLGVDRSCASRARSRHEHVLK